MTAQEVKQVLERGEGESLDLTQEFSKRLREELSARLAALANTVGGYLMVGVAADKKIVGCDLNDNQRAQISQAAKNCKPVLPIDIEDVEVDGRNVVVVSVRKARLLHADNAWRFPHRIGDSYTFLDIGGILNALQERNIPLPVAVSPGTLAHLFDPTQSKRTEPAADELGPILVLLRSPYIDAKVKAFDQLEGLSYRRKIEMDASVIEALSQYIGKGNDGLQRGALRVLFVLLANADPEAKAVLVGRFIQDLLDLLEGLPVGEILTEILRVISIIPDQRVVERLVKLIHMLPDEEYTRAQPSPIFHSLKAMGMDTALRKRLMVEMAEAENPRTRKRLGECLEYLQRG